MPFYTLRSIFLKAKKYNYFRLLNCSITPGRVVTQFQIAALFGSAYLEAATITNAINSFQKRNAFSNGDFLAAEATDINLSKQPLLLILVT